MKKFLLGLMLVLLTCGAGLAKDQQLYVSLWAEYLPGWVWQRFTEETGIKVIPKFYAQRAGASTQLAQTMPPVDLALAWQGASVQLKSQGLIQAIDYSRLQNFSHLQLTLLPALMEKNFSHAVPFDWHVMGLIINKELIDVNLVKSFADLWRPELKGKVFLPEEPRILASLALMSLGYSPNSANAEELAQAYAKALVLVAQVDGVGNYGMMDAMSRGSAAAALVWNGMPGGMLNLAAWPSIAFVLPQGQPLLLVECWVIPKNAQNQDAAYAFMDFLMRPDIAGRLGRELGYPTINQAVSLPEVIYDNVLFNPPLKLVEEAVFEGHVPALDESFGRLRAKLAP